MPIKKLLAGLLPLLLLASMASAQDVDRLTRQRKERMARDAWQPVRTVQNAEPIPAGEPEREVQPMPLGDQVIVDGAAPESVWIESEPVLMEPSMGGPLACDAIGGCDGAGCDGIACGHCAPAPACGWRRCVTLCFPQDGWASFEYLLWYADGMDLPPLVAMSPAGTAEANAGVPSRGASVLFGGGEALNDSINGGRLRVGLWLDACHTWGVEGEFFRLGAAEESFSRTGNANGSPILGRPFFDVTEGVDRAQLVSYPDRITGTVSAHVQSRLTGAGLNFRRLLACGDGCGDAFFAGLPAAYTHRLDGLIGYRFMQLDDDVAINERLTSLDTDPAGNFSVNDTFSTRSQFNGLDLGVVYRRSRGYWTLDLLAKLAFGTTRQTVDIRGSTSRTQPTAETEAGGLLALPGANIGSFKRDRFSVVPEVGATIGYQLTDQLRLTTGYTFIYWSNVVRAGDQINLDINPQRLPFSGQDPGVARPEFAFVDSDYWAHGVSFGGEYRW